ncbi:hypothetical protein KIW84_073636 [Lathyrus oleraceus]|uniref:Disease resistance protein Roq1-like winged-helix domain-containing protein n=1 Tax=Pisum sativum TaxID=3888 RepID=A0A9D4VQM4_PEA|nr:hypothetical protein KIW84_073636 [Pisum sativum]
MGWRKRKKKYSFILLVYSSMALTNVLNCCGFQAEIGLRVLVDKSLISLSEEIHTVIMHGLLEELGQNIVLEESRKWSRVWLPEQFYNVKLENMEKKVQAVCHNSGKDSMIMAEALSKMSHLRLLIMKGVNISENLSFLSNELRYMEWYRYPFKYLPSSFHPNQLVELILRYSSIKQLWKGKKVLCIFLFCLFFPVKNVT